jgi:hypothetical protein
VRALGREAARSGAHRCPTESLRRRAQLATARQADLHAGGELRARSRSPPSGHLRASFEEGRCSRPARARR